MGQGAAAVTAEVTKANQGGTMGVTGMAKRKRRGVNLSLTETARIRRRLLGELNGEASAFGYVCSYDWARRCLRAIESGEVELKTNIQRELHRKRVYPPAGPDTRMVENDKMVWVPPDITGAPLDQREDNLSLVEGCKLPPSCSAVMLRAIEERRARPERTQLPD